jgi:hypothetical protein
MESMELIPNRLKALCEVDLSGFAVGWPLEGSLHKTVVTEVYSVIVKKSGSPEEFPYVDCWQNAVLSQHKWLRPCLEEACNIMVARVTSTSRCREKPKELILAEEPEEIPLPYMPLYPPLPLAPNSTPSPLKLDGEV